MKIAEFIASGDAFGPRLTAKAIAARLRVSTRSVQEWIRQGELAAELGTDINGHRAYLTSEQAFADFCAARNITAAVFGHHHNWRWPKGTTKPKTVDSPTAIAPDAEPPTGQRRHPGCGGTLLSLYARLGAGSTWTVAGRTCRRCSRYWPSAAIQETVDSPAA